MKFFIAVSALLSVAFAKPSGIIAPAVYSAPAILSVPATLSSQYHSQDTLGQYSYGYSNPLSAKVESRALDGTTIGGYSYVDPAGKVQSVEYTSDALNGFRVAASNLPVAPVLPQIPVVSPPVPVQDTPEVAEAKAKHLEAVKEAKARAAEFFLPAAEVKSATVAVGPVLSLAAPVVPLAIAPNLALKSVSVETKPADEAVVVEAKSALGPEPEAKSTPAPETKTASVAEVKTAPAATVVAPAVAVKSFVSPAIAVRTAPLVGPAQLVVPAIGYPYGINSVFGYSTVLAEPTLTAYAAPLEAHFLAAPVHSAVVQKIGEETEKKQ